MFFKLSALFFCLAALASSKHIAAENDEMVMAKSAEMDDLALNKKQGKGGAGRMLIGASEELELGGVQSLGLEEEASRGRREASRGRREISRGRREISRGKRDLEEASRGKREASRGI